MAAVMLSLLAIIMGFTVSHLVEGYVVRITTETMAGNVAALGADVFHPNDFLYPAEEDAHYRAFEDQLKLLLELPHVVRVKVFGPPATLIWSDERSVIGNQYPSNTSLATAFRGEVAAQLTKPTKPDHATEASYDRLYEAYIPLVSPETGEVMGVTEVYQTVDWLYQEIRTMQLVIWGVTIGGLLLVYAALYTIVARASRTIDEQQKELIEAGQALETSYMGTIESLAETVDAKGPYTRGHSARVALIAAEIARLAGLPDDFVRDVYDGSLLHDIGKIGVPDSILAKPGPLTKAEWRVMRAHPLKGSRILEKLRSLRPRIRNIVLHHHERIDGSGYPEGLANDEVPLEARIVGIADAYDAMRSNRAYRPALSLGQTIAELRSNSGVQFDAGLVSLVLRNQDRIEDQLDNADVEAGHTSVEPLWVRTASVDTG